MKCQVCNVEVTQGAAFCQDCGAKLPMFDEMSTQTASTDPGETVPQRSKSSEAVGRSSAASSGVRRRGPSDVPEETLWEGSFSPKAMLGLVIGCSLLSLVLLFVAFGYASGIWRWILLFAFVVAWLAVAAPRLGQKRLGINYKLTTHMFYHQHGVLTRVTDRIELIEIHDVTYEQGLFERPVNVGKIKIASGDRTDPMLLVTGVENVESVAQMIDKARRGEQVRRGRRIDFSHIDGET